ncbi:hypothetical protein [Streptomyces europaeiscabiei]|uniref:hypothetical protein n=1 Tax=Streptomyces europaeiscabiei TaxID=146819 RepID=UPI002E17603F
MDGQPRRLPYDDPTYVAMHLELKMPPADFVATTRFMTAQCWVKAGQQPSMDLLKEMLAAAAQHGPGSLRSLLEEFTTRAEAS